MSFITVSITLSVPNAGQQRLQMAVTETSANISKEVFVYQRRPLPPNNPALEDSFVNIASVADLNEYPINAPGPDFPFFRLSTIDLIFRNIDLMSVTVEKIKTDLNSLVKNVDAIETVTSQTEFTAGVVPP